MFPAYVAHIALGRIRIKVPAKRGDNDYFSKLEANLKNCPDIVSVRINPLAASVLVVRNSNGDLKTLADFARKHRLFALKNETPPPERTVGEILAKRMETLDNLLSAGSRGRLDGQSALLLTFIALGLAQTWRGQIAQPAVGFLWYIMEILKDIRLSQRGG